MMGKNVAGVVGCDRDAGANARFRFHQVTEGRDGYEFHWCTSA